MSNDISVDVDDIRKDSLTSSLFVYQRYSAKDQGGRYAEERRIPKPYPSERFLKPWEPIERDIGKIPSVLARPITTGVERTLSPSKISLYSDVLPRSTSETPKSWRPTSDIALRATPKSRRDARRDAQFMPQQRYLKNFPLLCALRRKLNVAISGR